MAKKPKSEWDYMSDGCCPRCHSARRIPRLDGSSVCKNCGQRWTQDCKSLPSYDKRDLNKKYELTEEEEEDTIKEE
jgi:hypothetical protein